MVVAKIRGAMDCTLSTMNMIFMGGGGVVAALGIWMLKSDEWKQVYGTGIIEYAAYVTAFGLFVVLTSFCGFYGLKKNHFKVLLVYGTVLIILLLAQIVVAWYLYERFWGDLNPECAQKGAAYYSNASLGHAAVNVAALPSSTAIDNAVTPGSVTVDCSSFIENKLRLTAYVLWQKLYRDYNLYKLDPKQYSAHRTNARIALELAAKGKCCGFGAPASGAGQSPVTRPCKRDPRRYDFAGYWITAQKCATKAGHDGKYCRWELESSAGGDSLLSKCGETEDGAEYDMPIGCEVGGPLSRGQSEPCYEHGCADVAYAFLRAHVYLIGVVLGLMMIAELFGILTVCMFLGPHKVFALLLKNVLLGVQHLTLGVHRFMKCLTYNLCHRCNAKNGGAGGDEETGGDAGGDGVEQELCCGWLCDCIWCCCCCWICLGVCRDNTADDEDENDDKNAGQNQPVTAQPESQPLSDFRATKIAV